MSLVPLIFAWVLALIVLIAIAGCYDNTKKIKEQNEEIIGLLKEIKDK